jgi:hypothetical protein
VEFEDPQSCIDQLADANIGVYKLQVTAGLRLPKLSLDTRRRKAVR